MATDANGNYVPDSIYNFSLGNYGLSTGGTGSNTTDWKTWAQQNNIPLVYNQSYMQGMKDAQTQLGSSYMPSDRLQRTMYSPQQFVSTNYTGFGSDYIGNGKLFASGGDALGAVGDVLGGVGSLAQAWTAMKGLDFAKEAAKTQEAQWNKNYEAQRTATNNAIANQNAWKLASGRTDTSAYVGDWSNAANLQPAAKV
jgi:hypothetical protein